MKNKSFYMPNKPNIPNRPYKSYRPHLLFIIYHLLFIISAPALAQTAYDYTRLKGERLNRGVVAFRTSADSVCIQWRYLPTDPQDIAFDILRDGQVIGHCGATAPTFFMDANPCTAPSVYEVKPSQPSAPQPSTLRSAPSDASCLKNSQPSSLNPHPSTSSCSLPANAPIGYLDIPLTPGELPSLTGGVGGL